MSLSSELHTRPPYSVNLALAAFALALVHNTYAFLVLGCIRLHNCYRLIALRLNRESYSDMYSLTLMVMAVYFEKEIHTA